MIPERIKKIFRGKRQSEQSLAQTQNCIGFYESGGGFGFTTYRTNLERERIIAELRASGSSVIGVMDSERARKLAMMDSTTERPPGTKF